MTVVKNNFFASATIESTIITSCAVIPILHALDNFLLFLRLSLYTCGSLGLILFRLLFCLLYAFEKSFKQFYAPIILIHFVMLISNTKQLKVTLADAQQV